MRHLITEQTDQTSSVTKQSEEDGDSTEVRFLMFVSQYFWNKRKIWNV